METPQEQQPVRRQPGNEKSGRPIRDNMDMEGALRSGVKAGKERSSSVSGGDAKDNYDDQSQKAKN